MNPRPKSLRVLQPPAFLPLNSATRSKYRERAFRVELGETAGQGKIIVDRKVSALFPPEFFKDVIPLTVGFGRHEWLDGIDHRYKYLRQWSAMKCSANEYFRRQVWVSADPEERTLPSTVELLGEDKFFFGSDVPHAEGYENPLAEAQKHLKSLSQSA